MAVLFFLALVLSDCPKTGYYFFYDNAVVTDPTTTAYYKKWCVQGAGPPNAPMGLKATKG